MIVNIFYKTYKLLFSYILRLSINIICFVPISCVISKIASNYLNKSTTTQSIADQFLLFNYITLFSIAFNISPSNEEIHKNHIMLSPWRLLTLYFNSIPLLTLILIIITYFIENNQIFHMITNSFNSFIISIVCFSTMRILIYFMFFCVVGAIFIMFEQRYATLYVKNFKIKNNFRIFINNYIFVYIFCLINIISFTKKLSIYNITLSIPENILICVISTFSIVGYCTLQYYINQIFNKQFINNSGTQLKAF